MGESGYEWWDIIKIFDSKEEAQMFVADSMDEYFIEEYEVYGNDTGKV